MDSTALTPSQLLVLNYIKAFLSDNGYPPTRVEIQKHFRWKSANSAHCVIRALHRKGFISQQRGIARGIKVLTDGQTIP